MYCDFVTAHFAFRLDAEFDGKTVTVPLIREINYFPGLNRDEEPLKINLSFMLRKDREAFAEMNEHEDERHQVHLDSLKVRGIRIEDGITPRVSIDYIFREGGRPDDWGRCAYGELTDMDKILERDYDYHGVTAKKGEYLPISIYTKGPHVTW